MRITIDVERAKALWGSKMGKREFDALCGLITGDPPSDIAERMGITTSTLSSMQSRIWVKLDVRNRMEMMALATALRVTIVDETAKAYPA